MGRPALLGSHPRGPQYRGVQVPPHYGNRPRWRKKRTTYLTQCKNPKSIVPALSRSEMTIQDRRNHSRHQGKAKQTIIPDRVAQHNRHLHQTIHHARTLPGGNHAEVAGLLPPVARSAAIDSADLSHVARNCGANAPRRTSFVVSSSSKEQHHCASTRHTFAAL